MRFSNKAAIVTGAGSGIGRATALAFASEGAKVVAADAVEETARKTVSEIEAMGQEALAVKTDVTSLDDVKRMVQKCLDKFGKIDILVNSAGRWSPSEYTYPMYDLPEKDWYSVMDVNVTGTFLCSKYVAKQMIKQGNGGKIVNMGSTASKYVRHRIGGIGETIGLGGAYTTSKHAVVGLTRSLAMQLAPYKINVNCVCPTTCDTPLNKRYYEVVAKTKETTPEEVERAVAADHPLGRTLRAGEVAQLILFLCSEDAAMMTAEDVNLSGGIVYW